MYRGAPILYSCGTLLADEQTNGAVPSRPAAPGTELRPELRPDIGYIARVVVLGTGKLVCLG